MSDAEVVGGRWFVDADGVRETRTRRFQMLFEPTLFRLMRDRAESLAGPDIKVAKQNRWRYRGVMGAYLRSLVIEDLRRAGVLREAE